ncbi:hypothetical protein [Mesorhizobium sophorae]|uniref:hypothetical protein n=1 Tax=Mesorhizobium sophorae TaxID=1300294 RepID=UPI001FD9B75E|nr:hypothetical protein [Mesorhizobium sophorae]
MLIESRPYGQCMRLKFVAPLMPTLVEKPPEGDGIHEVKSTATAPRYSIGLSYIRSRRTRSKKTFIGPSSSSDRWRDRPLQTFIHYGAGADSVTLVDELPISRSWPLMGSTSPLMPSWIWIASSSCTALRRSLLAAPHP